MQKKIVIIKDFIEIFQAFIQLFGGTHFLSRELLC